MQLEWLWIGDTHAPYAHTDALDFLKAIKKTYKPKNIGHVGDEADGHAWSFHKPDPGLYSAGHEYMAALDWLQDLHSLFPQMTLLESNHGSLFYRKQKDAYLPEHVFKNYNEIWEVSDGWKWHFDYTFKLPNGLDCYAHHGKTSRVINLSQSLGMCALQGHFHEKMGAQYWCNPKNTFWAAQSGCLIDDRSRAFAYNNNNIKRPIMGSLGIDTQGNAVAIPMILNKRNRWVKRLL